MHQCLSCGNIIPDEQAVEVLRGCKECKGTRFYYTEAAMTQAERDDILRRSQADVSQVVAEVLQREAPESAAGLSDVHDLTPKDLRRILREVQGRQEARKRSAGTPEQASWEYEDATPLGIETEASRKRVAEELEAAAKRGAKPDTVDVGDGSYEIDVKALLERNPIVVHKDGAYVIHLPSLFEQSK